MKKILLSLLVLGSTLTLQAQFGMKALEKAISATAPAEPEGDEATIKLYADAARTKEIKTISDGMTKLYFRAYIWKDRTKRGDSPYKPMEAEYCFNFKEGKVDRDDNLSGFDYGDVKSEIDGEASFASYVGSHDYIDIDVDLMETQFLDYFVSRNDEKRQYDFTARLSGQCKFPLANSHFQVDFSQGKAKYDKLLLAENDDVSVKPDLYPNDVALHENAARLLKSTYGIKSYKRMHFIKDWETTGNGVERRIAMQLMYEEDGKCYISYFKVWETLLTTGWSNPSSVNERTNYQVDCSKL